MSDLESRLKRQLQQNSKVKIIQSSKWSIPVHSVEVEYKPVKRKKMDVLMKMMLIAFQKAEIISSEELSEILLVEQLFIQDLIEKMRRTNLIEQQEAVYRLTTKGQQQLKNGVFEEEQEIETSNVLYSPCHEAFVNGDLTDVHAVEKELDIYRYVREDYLDAEYTFEHEQVIEALQLSDVETIEGDAQTVVSEIVSTTDLYIDDIPCFEFILYNKAEDIVYARVWNTLIDQWDETLEQELNEKERLKWREELLG